MLTKRKFILSFFEGTKVETCKISLNDIIDALNKRQGESFEYFYALDERIDDILDMKIGQTNFMSFNRDNIDGSKGVIKRVE